MVPGATPPPLLLLAATAACVALVLGLRRLVPQRRWLAMVLAIAFGPAGHLYLKGAALYVVLMYAAWFGLLIATPLPPLISAFLLTVLSALLMNARIPKAQNVSNSR